MSSQWQILPFRNSFKNQVIAPCWFKYPQISSSPQRKKYKEKWNTLSHTQAFNCFFSPCFNPIHPSFYPWPFLSRLFSFFPPGRSRWPERCGTLSSLRRLLSPRQTSPKSICRGWGGSLSTGTLWMSVCLAKIWCPTTCLTTFTIMWLCGPKTSEFAHLIDQYRE